jgi:hypothetical protein
MTELAQQPTRFCLQCRHALHGLEQSTHRCPECGRDFDPANPRTFSKYSYGENWAALAQILRIFTRISVVCTAGAFLLSFFGVDHMWVFFLAGLPMMSVILLLPLQMLILWIAQTAGGWQALSRRWMMAGWISIAVFLSIMITQWPLRVNFHFHKPWLERAADAYATVTPPPQPHRLTLNGKERIGLLGFRRVVMLHNGNIGFQLSGGLGGGMYLVRTAPGGKDLTWYNCGVQSLGNNWHIVHED